MKILISTLALLLTLDLYAETIKVMSFNTGTTPSKGKRNGGPEEYSRKLAKTSDNYYGNGLAWLPAVAAAKKFITDQNADIIGFQEMFDSRNCSTIPKEFHNSFICEGWRKDAPMVIQQVTSEKYQIACHIHDSEKCIAVKKSFGYIEGCYSDICLDALEGEVIKNCGGRSRVGKAIISSYSGEKYNVIHVHGTSGFKGDDKDCRKKQFSLMFNDYPESGNNIILGDFNTDPNKLKRFDRSAKKLKELAKANKFKRVNGSINRQTYAGLVTLDHIYTDSLDRVSCKAYGVSKNTGYILNQPYFDHVPLVCELSH